MHCRVLRLLLLLGCGASAGCHHHRAVALAASPEPPAANLVLGSTPGLALLAQTFGRSEWPITVHGYRDDEVTFYGSFLYDQQYHFDDQGGLLYETQTFRSGAWTP